MGGTTLHPGYHQVCTGRTGQAEVVEITFDPGVVSYLDLLDRFWSLHDPTQLNRQGPDIGTNYRSAIFTHSEEQRIAAETSKKRLQESGRFGSRKIVTEIVPAPVFWPAEESHQQYFEKRGKRGCPL